MAGGQTLQKELSLPTGTYLLGNNHVGLVALMYRTLGLKEGVEIVAPTYFPENFMPLNVRLQVEPQRKTIQVGGTSYYCYVVQISQFGPETDYVSTDGILVRAETPSRKVVIELAR